MTDGVGWGQGGGAVGNMTEVSSLESADRTVPSTEQAPAEEAKAADMDVMLGDILGGTCPGDRGLGGAVTVTIMQRGAIGEAWDHVSSPREARECKYLFGTLSKSALRMRI